MPASNTIVFLIIDGNPPSPDARSSVTEWLTRATGASWQKSSVLGRLPTYNETHSRWRRGWLLPIRPHFRRRGDFHVHVVHSRIPRSPPAHSRRAGDLVRRE